MQAQTFTERWRKWWDVCNPEWRVRNNVGTLEKGGEGDWSSMVKPGPNGFVLVIGALVGLLSAAERDVWVHDMLDVHWVLQEVLISQR